MNRRLAWSANLLLAGVTTLAVCQSASTVADQRPPVCPNPRRASAHPGVEALQQVQRSVADDPSVLMSPEPVPNIGLLRYQVRDYADCTGNGPCYWADLDAQTKRAEAVLNAAVAASPKKTKLALVLDIDETSLSSYCEVTREDFGYIPDRFEHWIVSEEASIPVPGTLRLARAAQAKGVTLFFITGRPESQRPATERNLATAGYRNWQHLSLRQSDQLTSPTAEYKAAERRKILAEGYTLVLNMGDQWSDLTGDPMAEHSVKLPNPFYYLP